MGWSYAFSAFMDNTLAASRGLGKSAVPMAIVILGSCVFRVIWVYTIFAMFHTLTALYLLYIFSWSLTAIGQMVYFFRTYQKQTDGWEVPQTSLTVFTQIAKACVGGDPTSPHWVPTNSHWISVKTVCSAGSMWASTPTNAWAGYMQNRLQDINWKDFRQKHVKRP